MDMETYVLEQLEKISKLIHEETEKNKDMVMKTDEMSDAELILVKNHADFLERLTIDHLFLTMGIGSLIGCEVPEVES